MPETKPGRIIFTTIMVFCMVYSMTVYTLLLDHGGLTSGVLLTALREMWIEYLIVFALEFFVITRAAVRLACRIVPAGKSGSLLLTATILSITVLLTVPAITLFATFLHGGADGWLTSWLQTALLCCPAACILQIFFVGPLVRRLFRALFRRSRVCARA